MDWCCVRVCPSRGEELPAHPPGLPVVGSDRTRAQRAAYAAADSLTPVSGDMNQGLFENRGRVSSDR